MNDVAEPALGPVYAAIFIDAIRSRSVTGRSPTARSTPRSGSTLTGGKDILGLWAGTVVGVAKFWMAVLTDIKNRGVTDAFFVVCDGLKGPARGGRQRVAPGDRADLHHPPDPQHVPLGLPKDWDALKRDR